MNKIDLPKWAVVHTIASGRLIHIGNGVFVAADAQTPKVLETAIPAGTDAAELQTDVTAEAVDGFDGVWELGSLVVNVPVVAPVEEPAAENVAETTEAQ